MSNPTHESPSLPFPANDRLSKMGKIKSKPSILRRKRLQKPGGSSKAAKTQTIFSFFSGAGFLDLGFEMTGYKIAFANELDSSFADAYEDSRRAMDLPEPLHGVHRNGIEEWARKPQSKQLREWIESARRSNSTVGFIGGPPCPDFSVGGKNRGRHGEHGQLTATYFQLIASQRPDWFLFENVKGLWRTKTHRLFYDEMRSLVEDKGYATADRLVNAIEYGVPQDRERIIMIGLAPEIAEQNGFAPGQRISELQFPWELGRKFDRTILKSAPWPPAAPFGTMGDMPQNLPRELTVDYWFERNAVTTHPNSQHVFKPRAGLERFLSVDEGDDSRKSFKRLHRWRYSPTACYGNNEVHLHPTEARRLTVAEALAIQSLPRTFQLPPTMTLSSMFKTVGNGVPFLLARGLAEMMKAVLR